MTVISTPYGLLGHQLAHSWSPQIHELLGSAPYSLIETTPDEFNNVLANGSWKGLNVTIPYKRKALLAANTASEAACAIGAANTLVRYGNMLFADNTDVVGFHWLLERFARREKGLSAHDLLCKKTVLVLGTTGGAGRAVSYLCKKLGAHVIGVTRKAAHHELCHEWITYRELDRCHDAMLIVNCTPVGMYPHCPQSPLSPDALAAFPELIGSIDLIYNPLRSGLILEGLKRGVATENGLGMLVAQAHAASMLFQAGEEFTSQLRIRRTAATLHDLDAERIELIERTLAHKMQNIVLIGMPGAGKTSAGGELARLCGRPFIDIDTAIHDKTGKSPSEIIREFGEAYFRDIESDVTKEAGSQTGCIIACGGGVVVRAINYNFLKQNGHLIFLDRPIERLSAEHRPLTATHGLKELASKRMPLYLAWKDTRFVCTGSPVTDAQALKSLFLL